MKCSHSQTVSVELWTRGPKGHISCTWVQCATKSKKTQQIRSQGGHLVFPIGPLNTNLVEDVEILLPVKFSLNFIQRFQRRSRKCLSQSEARVAILFFRSVWKNTNLVEEVEILLPVNFQWIPFSGFREEVENVSDNQRPGPPSCFSNQPNKTQTW